MPLINWSHLPCNSLDGVTSGELNFLSGLSASDHSEDTELKEFIRFITTDGLEDNGVDGIVLPEVADIPSQLDVVELESLPRSSRDQMMQYGNMFATFVRGHADMEVSEVSERQLAEYLRFFYFTLKKADGSCYSPSTLVCMRAGIQRYLNLVVKRQVNIIAGLEFVAANRMLRVKVRQFHNSGGSVKQHEPIEEGDLKKIRDYFDRSTAERLQDEVLFTMLYVLEERGQEHLGSLKQIGTLKDGVDADGNPYLMLPALPTKNQSSDPTKCKGNQTKQSRIYGQQRALILHYQSLLPPSGQSFFPRPLSNDATGKLRYSTTQVRGINWLSSFLKHLSETCNLSKKYTNHSVRVTRIADLFDKGYALGEIMAVTGQRSEATVRRYLARKRDRTIRAVATAISSNLEKPSSSTASEEQHEDNHRVVRQAQIDLHQVQQPMFGNCLFDGCTFNF